jgi:hypothetical protein
MSIRAGFLLMATILVALLGGILHVMTLLLANGSEFEANETRHHESYELVGPSSLSKLRCRMPTSPSCRARSAAAGEV